MSPDYTPPPEVRRQREAFANWLQRELDAVDWTGSDLARKMDVFPSLIRKWLTEQQLPKPKQCAMLAEALNLPLDAVLDAAGHRGRAGLPESAERREAYDLVAALPEGQLPTVLRMLRALVEPERVKPGDRQAAKNGAGP